ncbi:unnamed protein product [Gongylonema pulchrum]|uniref:PCI domain-containing protein n=1 Tax=Gongylonema pulchrum TaxID=637853 RepID=A0A183EMV5_9BILA|nr:unnamed protein product [Gongylonema pulchrum]
MGQLQDAAKLYNRGIREYCTSHKHIIQMLMNWIEVTVHLKQWQHLDPLIVQADRALLEAVEVENVAATSTSRPGPRAVNSTLSATRNMKKLITTSTAKVIAVSALSHLNSKNYRQVAKKCLKIEFDSFDCPTLLAAKDIVMFGTICALATFDRSELKKNVLENEVFRKFLEAEPKYVELVQKFVKSQFGICFDLMDELHDELLLNMYLWMHVKQLYQLIRRRAIVQYFTPYATINMNKMALVFRVTVDELEDELVDLISSGEMCARIDSSRKILYAKSDDQLVFAHNEYVSSHFCHAH